MSNARCSMRRQAGISALGVVALLVVIAVAISLALRLGPHYADFYTMQKLIEELPAGQVHETDRREIRTSLGKRFIVNNIRQIKVDDAISIERLKGETIVRIDYEAREHLVSNIDAVLRFEKEYKFQ